MLLLPDDKTLNQVAFWKMVLQMKGKDNKILEKLQQRS